MDHQTVKLSGMDSNSNQILQTLTAAFIPPQNKMSQPTYIKAHLQSLNADKDSLVAEVFYAACKRRNQLYL